MVSQASGADVPTQREMKVICLTYVKEVDVEPVPYGNGSMATIPPTGLKAAPLELIAISIYPKHYCSSVLI